MSVVAVAAVAAVVAGACVLLLDAIVVFAAVVVAAAVAVVVVVVVVVVVRCSLLLWGWERGTGQDKDMHIQVESQKLEQSYSADQGLAQEFERVFDSMGAASSEGGSSRIRQSKPAAPKQQPTPEAAALTATKKATRPEPVDR